VTRKKVQSVKHDVPGREKQAVEDKQVSVVRLEIKKGALTETHRHEAECLVIVLEGAFRVYLRDRAVTIRENQMLHIPPEHEHFAEALADTVALSISSSPTEWTGCGPFLHEDPDQYLWGV
jgi:quercetin dioxygenase-like cupin family protein